MKKYCSYFILVLFLNQFLLAQNPIAFQIGSEEGIPNQTIYSIIEDKKGFIWLGTDAGVCRYDGIRFKEYKHPKQLSRSLTGFVIDSKGRIYGYNFKDQLFYIEHDSLHLLDSWNKGRITNIAVDLEDNLWVCHTEGIEKFSPINKQWAHYKPITEKKTHPQHYLTHSCYVDNQNVFWCLSAKGLLKMQSGKIYHYPVSYEKGKLSGVYQLAFNGIHKFIFSVVDGEIFSLVNDKIKPFYSKNLNPLLKDKKITRVEEDTLNNLWIYTYTGVIVYSIKHDSSRIYFQDKAFSCGIKDINGIYWFCSLYDGLMKVPKLSNYLLEIKDEFTNQNKISKVISNDKSIYFSTTTGKIGEIKNNQVKLYDLKSRTDIGTLAFSSDSLSVFFSSQNNIYKLNNGEISILSDNLPPTKAILQIDDNYIVATSLGAYWYNPKKTQALQTLTNYWSRSIAYSKKNNYLCLATNNGVKCYRFENNIWVEKSTLLNDIQITSVCISETNNSVYFLTQNGKVYESTDFKSVKNISEISDNYTSYQLLEKNNTLFVATNKGLWTYDINSKEQNIINRLSGLATDNVSAISIDQDNIWLASTKGIEQLPISIDNRNTISKIYLKKIISDTIIYNTDQPLTLKYKQGFKVEIEASAFSSENQFQYAYSINDNDWNFLPATITEIDIPFLNVGNFKLEIKLIDHLGRDSQNKIEITGYVTPPFWQRWWFYVLIGFVCISIAFIIFKQRINIINKRQAKELARMQLEHELKLSQETALRAQMNPHFIFNVLNSIKSYIYENDKKKAASYLQRFSDLVRKILEQSSRSWVKLDEEIELLKLYIELESMLFINEFQYTIKIDDNIDTSHTLLPSLILQPFIENAFKHGLRHKLGEKKLDIVFEMDTVNSILNVTITDNGIGRNQSKIINDSNAKKHQSFSTDAINKVTVLNQNEPGIISVNYLDLYNNNHDSIGTSVVIKIKSND